jgi:hypothetical protein
VVVRRAASKGGMEGRASKSHGIDSLSVLAVRSDSIVKTYRVNEGKGASQWESLVHSFIFSSIFLSGADRE